MVACLPLMINPPPMVVVIVICLVLGIDHVYRTYSEATKDFVFIWPYLYRNWDTKLSQHHVQIFKQNFDVNRVHGDLVIRISLHL